MLFLVRALRKRGVEAPDVDRVGLHGGRPAHRPAGSRAATGSDRAAPCPHSGPSETAGVSAATPSAPPVTAGGAHQQPLAGEPAAGLVDDLERPRTAPRGFRSGTPPRAPRSPPAAWPRPSARAAMNRNAPPRHTPSSSLGSLERRELGVGDHEAGREQRRDRRAGPPPRSRRPALGPPRRHDPLVASSSASCLARRRPNSSVPSATIQRHGFMTLNLLASSKHSHEQQRRRDPPGHEPLGDRADVADAPAAAVVGVARAR